MSVRFALNGVGSIGRALIRIAATRADLELVAINDLGSVDQIARLLARDTLHGKFPGDVSVEAGMLVIDGRRIAVQQQAEAAMIDWSDSEIRVVVDATGKCSSREQAKIHLKESVEKVLVSANAAGLDLTICIGVNHRAYEAARHHLLSAASCTTNCLAPIAHVLHNRFGLKRGLLNTVHSYNNDQHLLDFPHHDPRRARAATLNMIPTTTSAIEALGRVIPELKGRFAGFAVRVPTPNVSLIDLTLEFDRPVTVDALNNSLRQAAAEDLKGILAVTEEELVSSDFMGSTFSATVDLPLTQSVDDRLFRIVAWYDNEWGHASRLADLLELVGRAG
ncbi:MAG: type I glyceraldehyde-3-phosphate dehydrogenase [Thermoanaerobaculia bacterium]